MDFAEGRHDKALECRRGEVIKERKKLMWAKIKSWLLSLFSKKTVERVANAAKDAIIDTASETLNEFVNNPKNRKAAENAIISVMKSGVTGNQALNDAVNILKANGLASGKQAANTLLRTLVQIVFATIKLN